MQIGIYPRTYFAADGATDFISGEDDVFRVEPASLDWGNVETCNLIPKTATIYNDGSSALTISNVIVDGTPFSLISPSFPQDIPASASLALTLGFHPTETGLTTGTATIICTDPQKPTLYIDLRGSGIPRSQWSYTFDTSTEGWEFFVVSPFNLPVRIVESGSISIGVNDNTNTFGYWRTYYDEILALEDRLYRARFHILTDITDPLRVPQIRLRANASNFQQADYLSVESNTPASAAPTPGGIDYDLYFVPLVTADTFTLSFDLLNFNPDDVSTGTVSLDSVVVDVVHLAALTGETLVTSYDFSTGDDGWTTAGAALVFTPPNCFHAGAALHLAAANNTMTFGYWKSPQGDIPLTSGRLYRGTFRVGTNLTNQASVPQLRLRFNTTDLQSSQVLAVESHLDGRNSPTPAGNTYSLYFHPPGGSDSGVSIIANFDMLNFTPEDDPTGHLTLEEVEIETLDVPNIP